MTAFFDKAAEKPNRWADHIVFRKMDIADDPIEQGFKPGPYDVIIADNVLHATARVENTLRRVRNLMKPGGHLA